MKHRSASTIPARLRAFLWIVPLVILAAAGLHAFAHKAAQADVLRADPEVILGNRKLRDIALGEGRNVFERHCQSCHGAQGKADTAMGVPDLTDNEHLYGTGTVAQIEDIARYGIRGRNKRGWNLAVMPAYATRVPDAAEALPPQTPAQIADLTQYLLSFTGRATDRAAVARGSENYTKAGCWDCHGRDLGGDLAIGAPSLTDNIWLYGGTPGDIWRTIARGRAGISPAFLGVLTPAQLRSVAVYVASLQDTELEQK